MADRNPFTELMRSLTSGESEATPQPENEEWADMIQRIHALDQIHAVTEETYFYFLEVLPPKWFNGNVFAFAEGQELLTVYWRRKGNYFCRRLTPEQTYQFCETSGLPQTYGM